jgi:hypothetical protein
MRNARSYSIVDHELYHGGYLHRLSHEALALYLFLVVVGDRDGRSFYGEATLREILRLDEAALDFARSALMGEGLIDVRKPYWWVRSLSRSVSAEEGGRGAKRPTSGSADRPKAPPPPAEEPLDRDAAKARLRDILQALGARRPGGEGR